MNNNQNWFTTNLPTILTSTSVIVGAATAAYSVWAGFKIHEKWEELPEEADSLEKLKVAVPYIIPTVAGIVISGGCAIGSNIENGKRIMQAGAAGATIAALTADKKDLVEKTKEFLGKDPETGKVDREKGEAEFKKITSSIAEDKAKHMAVGMGLANHEQLVTVHDLTTGYVWKTTIYDVYSAIGEYNEMNASEDGTNPISMFYEMSIPDGGSIPTPEPIYEDIYVDGVFRPNLDYEMGPDMQPILTLEWNDQRTNSVPINRCHGYVY